MPRHARNTPSGCVCHALNRAAGRSRRGNGVVKRRYRMGSEWPCNLSEALANLRAMLSASIEREAVYGGVGYVYGYPHKKAYRALARPRSLAEVWSQEPADALFCYVHLPFCNQRCSFCNLFTFVPAGDSPAALPQCSRPRDGRLRPPPQGRPLPPTVRRRRHTHLPDERRTASPRWAAARHPRHRPCLHSRLHRGQSGDARRG